MKNILRPGKKLNELVAVEVMGYSKDRNSKKWIMDRVGEGTVYGDLHDFSGDKDSAHDLIRKVEELGIGTLTADSASRGGYKAFLVSHKPEKDWCEYGETWAHAICLGALRAVQEYRAGNN